MAKGGLKDKSLGSLGLQNSRLRVDNIISQTASGRVVPKPDGRGKHTNRKNKLPEDVIQKVCDHIASIPKYQSHYSRKENSDKVFLDYDMNIAMLYRDYYVPWCQEQKIPPVTENRYRRIFCSEYNIDFKLPRSDTCRICDSLNISISSPENKEEKKAQITVERELHLANGKAMQNNMSHEAERAKTNPDMLFLSFDLQQALPIPKLTVGPAFYKSKLWVYNIGIHDCGTDRGHMYVWNETVAKRGADEVGSTLIKLDHHGTLATSSTLKTV